jgi:hypothetical protein
MSGLGAGTASVPVSRDSSDAGVLHRSFNGTLSKFDIDSVYLPHQEKGDKAEESAICCRRSSCRTWPWESCTADQDGVAQLGACRCGSIRAC